MATMTSRSSGDPRDGSPAGDATGAARSPGRALDPRAVRVALAAGSAHAGLAAMVVEPPDIPVAAASLPVGTDDLAHRGDALATAAPDAGGRRIVLVDGSPVEVDLRRQGEGRSTLGVGPLATTRHRVLVAPVAGPSATLGERTQHEVVVDGWRVLVEVEPAARAALRERASRGRATAPHSGPTEVRAIIPGVIVSVSVAAGDSVAAGQQLLVVEAMKMQNELRAPRDGTIERVMVGAGTTIDVGDVLVVIA
jgi:glutaconyl-CoA decarboxylase